MIPPCSGPGLPINDVSPGQAQLRGNTGHTGPDVLWCLENNSSPELFSSIPIKFNPRQETGDGNGKDQELAGDCVWTS